MYSISDVYNLKEDKYNNISYSKTDIYLGCKVSEFRDPDSEELVEWSISVDQYVNNAIKNVSEMLINNDHYLKAILHSPFPQ